MTIQEVIQSRKPFQRATWRHDAWVHSDSKVSPITWPNGVVMTLIGEDLLATDWQVQADTKNSDAAIEGLKTIDKKCICDMLLVLQQGCNCGGE